MFEVTGIIVLLIILLYMTAGIFDLAETCCDKIDIGLALAYGCIVGAGWYLFFSSLGG